MNPAFPSPFDIDRLCGSVVRVTGSGAVINLPHAANPQPKLHFGHALNMGVVGEYVVIECGHWGIVGRIDGVRLPEKDRLTVEDRYSEREEANPLGEVSLLASVNLSMFEVQSGVSVHPRLGASVYSAHPDLIRWVARRGETADSKMSFCSLVDNPEARVEVTPDSLFARHCAVVGSTGGGKSFTVATLLQKSLPLDFKIILIDSTGEFITQNDEKVFHCALSNVEPGETLVKLDYSKLRAEDLYPLFRPGVQVASVKLREAANSLRLVEVLGDHALVNNGLLDKRGASLQEIAALHREYKDELAREDCGFNVKNLANQIGLECLAVENDGVNYKRVLDGFIHGNCISLIGRIRAMVGDPAMQCLFGNQGEDLLEIIDKFFRTSSTNILRVSLRSVTEAHNCPAVIINALARYLLKKARDNKLRDTPVVFAVDEAHRYVGKNLTEEELHRMDGLELLAKEGRKGGLYMFLSTQRPRDLGQSVMSQLGTLISHRLTHPEDRAVIERSAGDFAVNASSILSGLSPGQAVIVGVEFPVPMTVKIDRPDPEPASDSPLLVSADRDLLPNVPLLAVLLQDED